MSGERSPGLKLVIVGAIGAMLIVPLAMVYWLVSDRQHQAGVAQESVTAAWAGAQVVAGPVLVVPYVKRSKVSEIIDGKAVERLVTKRLRLYVAPSAQSLDTTLDPEMRTRGTIHRTVVYEAAIAGKARFVLPQELERLDIAKEDLRLDEAIVQLPISDPRGLQTDATLSLGTRTLDLRPGLGTPDSGTGVHAYLDWSEGDEVTLDFAYGLRGSQAISLVPRGQETDLTVTSSWPHPSFSGRFLPGEGGNVGADGFKAEWSISNLALGQSLLRTEAPGLPVIGVLEGEANYARAPRPGQEGVATVRLIEPVDLYKQAEPSLKYGFLFIGFTFLTFLMFDIVGGARVASAEYGLTGAGLILFFVMLLAFSEVIGFAGAYSVASAAIIGLLTSYSAAVLGGWRRAGFIAALLSGLYGVLYVLLNLESMALVIGSLMLFLALAVVMYTTRSIDWSSVSGSLAPKQGDEETASQPA